MGIFQELEDILTEMVSGLHEPRTCDGCRFYRNGDCTLCSCFCVNSPYRPYWEPEVVVQQLVT